MTLKVTIHIFNMQITFKICVLLVWLLMRTVVTPNVRTNCVITSSYSYLHCVINLMRVIKGEKSMNVVNVAPFINNIYQESTCY